MEKGRKISLYKLFPSIITLLSLCVGITSIRYTFNHNIEMAVIMILIACFMDGIDGSAARFFKSASDFGAQLDSLCDLVNFGVAPAIVTYYWSLYKLGNLGWIAVLIYASCTALRLARYNVESAGFNTKEKPMNHNTLDGKNKYFHGVSSPLGGILILTPAISNFQILRGYEYNAVIILIYTILVGLMMVTRIPTLSTKGFWIEQKNIAFFMSSFVAFAILTLLLPWVVIPFLAIVYIFSIPCTWLYYGDSKFFKKQTEKDIISS